jgi:hypothetical protein
MFYLSLYCQTCYAVLRHVDGFAFSIFFERLPQKESKMNKEPFPVSFSILIREDDGLFVAHCLELDIVATGPTLTEAKTCIIDLIRAQLDYAFNNDNLDNLYHPAPREVWQEYYSCLHQEQERVRVSEEETLDRFVPPLIIANTCMAERKTTHG